MSKKVLLIVGLAAVIAAAGGVTAVSQQTGVSLSSGTAVTEAAVSSTDDHEAAAYVEDEHVVIDSKEAVADSVEAAEEGETEAEAEAEVEAEAEESPEISAEKEEADRDSGDAAKLSASYQILSVTDRTTGEESAPRVLFGRYANACRLSLYDDGSAELCLNPSSGEVDQGRYLIDGENMTLTVGGSVSSCRVVYSDEGDMISVIVPYNGYDVAFG